MKSSAMGEARKGTAETSRQCLGYIMYVGEHDGEICFHFYSKEEVAQRGIRAIEQEMQQEHPWSEKLGELDGRMTSELGVVFSGPDMEQLVFRCSRNLGRVEGLLDFEYRRAEWDQ